MPNSNFQQIYCRLKLLSSRLRTMGNLTNLGYLPRWIILFIDTAIVLFSAVFVYIMVWSMGLYLFNLNYIVFIVPAYLAINLFFFWLLRTYSGIIRHSSFIDAIKLGFASFATLVTLVIINFIMLYVDGAKIFMNAGLLINFVISFSTLFAYRILVKQIFEKYLSQDSKENLMRGLIYGSDENAIAVANALIAERPRRFKVVGFVDKNKQNTAKRILNLPIINLRKRVPVLMRSVEAEVLIIADKTLSKEEKLTIVDECLEFNYKVFTVPLISDWEDQKNIAKKLRPLKSRICLSANQLF